MSHVFLCQQLGDIFLELVRQDHNPNVDPWANFQIGSPQDGVKTNLAPLQAQRLSNILDHWVTLEDLPSDTLSSWPQCVEIGCSSTAFYPQLYVVLTDPKGERPYAEFTIQQEIASLDMSEVKQLAKALQSLQPAAWVHQGSLAKEETGTIPRLPKQASNNFTKSHDVMITGPAELRAWSKNASEEITRRWKEISPGFVKTSNQVLQDIRMKGVLDVQLEVPDWVSRGISNKELTIDKFNGVVRDIKTGKVRAWLPESKIGKSLSNARIVANLITFAVDLAEKHLVDERLNKIVGMMEQLDAKFDADWRGDFVTGFDLLRQHSIMSTDKDNQLQSEEPPLLHDVRILLQQVCNKNLAYAEICLSKMNTQAQAFKGKRLHFQSHREICSMTNGSPIYEEKVNFLKSFGNHLVSLLTSRLIVISRRFSQKERRGLRTKLLNNHKMRFWPYRLQS